MIDSLNSFINWLRTIISTVVSVLSGLFLKNYLNIDDFSIILIAVIIVLVIISKSIEFILHWVVNNSTGLRKVILGNHFIEGYWIQEFIKNPEFEAIERVTLTKISYSNQGYIVTGETFNFDCESRGTFHSKYSEYKNFCLEYAFEGLTSSVENIQVGNAEFKLVQTGTISKKIIGSITNNLKNYTVRMIAIKLNDDDAMRLDDEDEKRKILEDFIEARKFRERKNR